MERGASSALRTSVKELRADTMLDSERWKAGLREDIMLGVRTSTDGLAVLLWCECDNGEA